MVLMEEQSHHDNLRTCEKIEAPTTVPNRRASGDEMKHHIIEPGKVSDMCCHLPGWHARALSNAPTLTWKSASVMLHHARAAAASGRAASGSEPKKPFSVAVAERRGRVGVSVLYSPNQGIIFYNRGKKDWR